MDTSLHRMTVSATLHCLSGCAVGEVLGMVISSALHWPAAPSIALAVLLAFIFGYSFTLFPLVRHGLALRTALGLALAADTASIAVMEFTDNAVILLVPGAIHAGLGSLLFWASLAFSLVVAFGAAYPLNRWLIARGKGHMLTHRHHTGHQGRHT